MVIWLIDILTVRDNGPIMSLNAAQKRIEKTSNLLRSAYYRTGTSVAFSKKLCGAATLTQRRRKDAELVDNVSGHRTYRGSSRL
jgi:hypothetical protein